MTSDIPDLFDDAPVDDPEAVNAFFERFIQTSFLWANRNSIPGAWMMFGGKRPEPERNDPFKPVGE